MQSLAAEKAPLDNAQRGKPATDGGRSEIDRQIRDHAPRDRFDPTRTAVPETIRQSIREQRAIEAIVLSADIRRSASILKESIDIPHYANTLADFVGEFRTVLSYHGGWFDKFTGDGFLCYWLTDQSNFVEQMETVLDFSFSVMNNFRAFYYETFISNMRNVPTGIGLSIGVDAGPCYLLPIAGDLTVMGSPIVGAVRMNDACDAYQLMLNSIPGSRLVESRRPDAQLSPDLTYRLSMSPVPTKEYPEGQAAYRVDFQKKGKTVFAAKV